MRLPPANTQAEQALLGAILANNRALDRVEAFLRPAHFYDPLHGRVYELILARVAAGRVADAISLRGMVEHDQAFAEVGGAAYLTGLLTAMVGIINVGEYGRAIRDAWTRRELITLLADIVNRLFVPPDAVETTASTVELLESGLLRVMEGAGDEAPLIPFGDSVSAAVVGAVEASRRPTALAGLTTGYAALDRMTTGLVAPNLFLLAARPSMGKTGLGLGIGVRAAMTGAHVLFWSGEMSAAQMGARAASAYTGLSTQAVFTGRNWRVPADAAGRRDLLTQPDWDDLIQAERAAHTLPLTFDTRPGITVQALRARARRMKRAGKLHLIVVDYIGLMRTSGPQQPKLYEKITTISAELMALKAELGVPILALVQLNRANEARDDKMPQMSDLRDSGALEQDADVVMLLHRPHYYLSRSLPQKRGNETDEHFASRSFQHDREEESERGRATVNIAKNRHGPTGLTRLLFNDATTWFRDEGDGADGPAWSGRMDI